MDAAVAFLLWLTFSVLVGVLASRRGRSGFGWFVIAALLSPLIGVIILLLMRDLSPRAVMAYEETPSPGTHVRCPDCRELVRYDAVKCKHCGSALVPVGSVRSTWRTE